MVEELYLMVSGFGYCVVEQVSTEILNKQTASISREHLEGSPRKLMNTYTTS